MNGSSRSENGCEKALNGTPWWFLFRVNGSPPPPPNVLPPMDWSSWKWDGLSLLHVCNNWLWLAANELSRSLLLCILSFFATSSTTSLLQFNLVNGAVQPQRIVEVKVEKTMLVKYLNFVKSTNWKECFIPFSFFTQTPAEKRSVSEVESSSQEAQPEDCRAGDWNSS